MNSNANVSTTRNQKNQNSRNARHIPEGYHTVTPYLIFRDAARAIEFYKTAFNAMERYRIPSQNGRGIGHAEIKIGDSHIMLSEESPSWGKRAPSEAANLPVTLVLYVPNVDASFEQAVRAGAKVQQKVEDKFWGDRAGTLTDPFGYEWCLMTHKEDVSPQEMERRMKEACAEQSSGTRRPEMATS
jgi:PhnB protein